MTKPCKCGSVWIVNKTYNLCSECNHIRLHGITQYEAAQRRQKENTRCKSKKKRKPLKSSTATIKKRKETLRKDRALYLHIFNTKNNECEECSKQLPSEFENEEGKIIYIAQYSHILSKGAFPEFRHHKLNINRLCLKCHEKWEFGDKKNMKIFNSNQKLIERMKNEK